MVEGGREVRGVAGRAVFRAAGLPHRMTEQVADLSLSNVGVGPDPFSLGALPPDVSFVVLFLQRDHYCTNCRKQVQRLADRIDEFRERDAEVVSVSRAEFRPVRPEIPILSAAAVVAFGRLCSRTERPCLECVIGSKRCYRNGYARPHQPPSSTAIRPWSSRFEAGLMVMPASSSRVLAALAYAERTAKRSCRRGSSIQ